MPLPAEVSLVLKQYGVLGTLRLAVREAWRILTHQWFRGSYSQHFEDLHVLEHFDHKTDGTYVDVGCHAAKRLSNTYRLYKEGWSGVAIDASPAFADGFRKDRPRDTFVNVGIGSNSAATLPFYVHVAAALSTFSKRLSESYERQGHPVAGVIDVPIRTLAQTLDEHAGDREIDFMSVDVEGLDFEVLASNDWSRYRPRLVCVEYQEMSGRTTAPSADADRIDQLMRANGYVVESYYGPNVFYALGS